MYARTPTRTASTPRTSSPRAVGLNCGLYRFTHGEELPIARLCNDEECDFFRRYVQA